MELVDFPRYTIDNLGNLYRDGKKCKDHPNERGFRRVGLYSHNKRKTVYLHRLVAQYHGGYVSGRITHVDGDKTNNSLENLAWKK